MDEVSKVTFFHSESHSWNIVCRCWFLCRSFIQTVSPSWWCCYCCCHSRCCTCCCCCCHCCCCWCCCQTLLLLLLLLLKLKLLLLMLFSLLVMTPKMMTCCFRSCVSRICCHCCSTKCSLGDWNFGRQCSESSFVRRSSFLNPIWNVILICK